MVKHKGERSQFLGDVQPPRLVVLRHLLCGLEFIVYFVVILAHRARLVL